MKVYVDQIWKPYVSSHTKSVLILDEFICHKQTPFLAAMEEIGKNVELIPGENTCVLQSNDAGVI